MVVSVNARTAGGLTVNVLGDRLLTTQTVDVKEGTQQVKLTLGKDWGTGAYVMATLRRPFRCSAQRMPGPGDRAEMVRHRQEDARMPRVTLSPPPLVRPGAARKIRSSSTVSIPARTPRSWMAAVDVGILNLTNYKPPPAPIITILGQRRLTREIRDLCGQLIDGMQGTRGQIRVRR